MTLVLFLTSNFSFQDNEVKTFIFLSSLSLSLFQLYEYSSRGKESVFLYFSKIKTKENKYNYIFGKTRTFTIPNHNMSEQRAEGGLREHKLRKSLPFLSRYEDGIEVPNRDVKAYAEALKKMAADEDMRTRMGTAGKKRVEENFLNTQFKGNILRVVGGL